MGFVLNVRLCACVVFLNVSIIESFTSPIITRSLLRPSPHAHGYFFSVHTSVLAPFQENKQPYITAWSQCREMVLLQTGNKLHSSLSSCMFWNYKKPSLSLPFSLIETLLISCSSAHCWPIRRVIHLGDDDNSRWHTVIPGGLQTVWSSVGVKRKSASYLVIKQTQ